jgi:hypothetical protein
VNAILILFALALVGCFILGIIMLLIDLGPFLIKLALVIAVICGITLGLRYVMGPEQFRTPRSP